MNRLFSLQVGTFVAALGRYATTRGTTWMLRFGRTVHYLTV